MGLIFGLTAKNSTGEQKLVLDLENEKVFLCIYGIYKEKDFQIDFNGMDKEEFQEFTNYVNLINNKINNK